MSATETLASRHARALSPAQKAALALEIVSAYAQVRWRLWRSDVPRTLAASRAARRSSRSSEAVSETSVLGARLGHAVTRTLRGLPTDSRCLMQSLVLTHLLASRGIDSALVIGVAIEPEFAAHAWVESGDIPLLPTNGSAYTRLVRL